jgi:hypothetical protein
VCDVPRVPEGAPARRQPAGAVDRLWRVNISLTPAFDTANFVLLDAGGIIAVANLRGGREYGEEWHAAGMFERKQNVFDDFIAAAEWLIATGYSNPERIAIEGGSNGGLLVAAVMLQRPDLFWPPSSAACRWPTCCAITASPSGASGCPSTVGDDPLQFRYLHQYSPLHKRSRRRQLSADPDHHRRHRRSRVHREWRRSSRRGCRPPVTTAPTLIEWKRGRTRRRETGVEDDRRGRGHLRVPVQTPRSR